MTNKELVARYANKPVGVYRELIDSTRQEDVAVKTNVLVVIQSKHGRIMNPIYVKDLESLHATFGKRDPLLEMQGNYGILMAEQALEQGPIWVLNVKNINKNEEFVDSVHIATSLDDFPTTTEKVKISDVYDTSNFWKLNKFFATNSNEHAGLTFTSVDNGTNSIIVQKNTYPKFNYTVQATIDRNPGFLATGLDKLALVSDYMITVHVFKSDVAQIAQTIGGKSPFKKPSNEELNGSAPFTICLDKGEGDESLIAAMREHRYKYFKTYEGTVGDVIDIHGNNLNIVHQINADVLQSGISAAINLNQILKNPIDLSGLNGDADIQPINGLPRTFKLANDTKNAAAFSNKLVNKNFFLYENDAYVRLEPNVLPDKALVATDFETGDILQFKVAQEVLTTRIVESSLAFDNYQLPQDASLNTKQYPLNHEGNPYPKNAKGEYVYPKNHRLALQPLQFGSQNRAMDFVESELAQPNPTLKEVSADVGTSLTSAQKGEIAKLYGTRIPVIKLKLDRVLELSGLEFNQDTAVNPEDVQVGEYNIFIPHEGSLKAISGKTTTATIQIKQRTNVSLSAVHVLKGIVDKEVFYVNGTPKRQNDILDQFLNESFVNSLKDPLVFRCRYLVDTFKTYIEPNAKHQFAELADKAKRFLVFTSMPFYQDFLQSKNPDFHNHLGNFQMSYVVKGSNPDKLSSNSFSLPNSEKGCWLVPIMPVEFNDGYSSKTIPGVGVAAKLYYSKHTGTKKVYDIVGNKEFPVLAKGIVGAEKEFDMDNRAMLEQIGANIIMNIDGVLQFRSSLTAYQAIRSALNHPETLEKFLYLADMVEPIIQSKQFKYNNINSRTSIKEVADTICDGMLADGVIADYENICDLSNNPTEVRSAGLIVLDSILYNEFGIRIGVHRQEFRLPAK